MCAGRVVARVCVGDKVHIVKLQSCNVRADSSRYYILIFMVDIDLLCYILPISKWSSRNF